MALSAFDNKSRAPTDAELARVLGQTHAAWLKLIAALHDTLVDSKLVWAFSGVTTGWGARIVERKRIIVYMTPQADQFLVSFVLGERAVAAVHAAKLPATIIRAIDAAPRYAEGRGVRFQLRDSALVPALARLAQIKRDN